MRRWVLLVFLTSLASAALSEATREDSIGPEVRKYLRVATPRGILEHVQVIDGTGAAPALDRNISIEGGKITAISAGADQPPSEGTTVLDLRGYSVMPGIVGMHNGFKARQAVSRVGKIVAQRLGEVGCIRSLPDPAHIGDGCRSG